MVRVDLRDLPSESRDIGFQSGLSVVRDSVIIF